MEATTDTRDLPLTQQPAIMPSRSVTPQPNQPQQESEMLTSRTSEMLSKIAEFGEQIEVFEKGVIAASASVSDQEDDAKEHVGDISDEIESLLKSWTVEIQNRYKSAGELGSEDVEGLIMEVIKTQIPVEKQISLAQAVNDQLQRKIEEIESFECKKDIFNKALKKIVQNIAMGSVGTDVAKVEIEEIIKLISPELDSEEDKNKLKSLSDTQKFQLFMEYKTMEFLKLQSLIYNTEEEILDCGVPNCRGDISQTLEGDYSNTANLEESIEPQEQYNQMCAAKIVTICEELNVFEKRFSACSRLMHIITSIVEGLENFSSSNYNRHTHYDQILQKLEALSYSVPKAGISMSDHIEAIRKELVELKQKIVSEQWEHFVQEQQKKNLISEEVKTILGIVEVYCRSKNDNFNLEEFEYHIDNMIESGELTSQSLYTTINNLSNEADLKVAENETHKHFMLQALMLNRADQIELRKITELLESRLKYQGKQCLEILEIKTSITQEFSKYCGIFDRSNKENYTKIIKLYLDKLDRLVAEGNAGDISYSSRKEVFKTLKQNIAGVITNTALKDGEKAEYIEREISNTLSALIFATSGDLSIDILEHLNTIKDSSLETQSDYKRNTQTGQTIKLEDLFDDFGRVKEKEGNEVFSNNKTVIVNIDREEYYRLSEDIHSLKSNQATYKKSIEEYGNELSRQYKTYKLNQLDIAIRAYNCGKNIENLAKINKGLIFYLSLLVEHLESDRTFEDTIHKFLIGYHNTVKNLMITDKHDHEVISELRRALDLFYSDVMQEREINQKEEDAVEGKTSNTGLSYTLKALRKTLLYKTYKESGFKLFSEKEEQFALNSSLPEDLNEIIQESIPEIIWLRSFIMPKSSDDFFNYLTNLINEKLADTLAGTTNASIVSIKTFISQEKNKIVLSGLVDEELNVEDFVKQITMQTLSWQTILANSKITDQLKFKKLSLIIKEHHAKFAKEDLENLLLVLNEKETNAVQESLAMIVLRFYTMQLLEDTKNTLREVSSKEETLTEKLEMGLDKSIMNALNVWQISQSLQRKTSHLGFIEHLKQLVTCMTDKAWQEDNIGEMETKLEQENIRFITEILGIAPTIEPSSKDTENVIFAKYPEKDEDKISFLILLFHLPDSFFSNKTDYKKIIESLVNNVREGSSEQSSGQSELHMYIREHISKYYKLFLDQILNTTEDVDRKKSDIQDALKRLSNNISATDFIKLATKWIKAADNKVQTNFVLKMCQQDQAETTGVDLSYILPFLYSDEKEHLKSILSLGDTGQQEAVGNLAEEELDKAIVRLLKQHSKRPTTNIISNLKQIFTADTGAPIHTWTEELIHLRLNAVRNLILSKIPTQDHGTTKLADILNALRSLQEEKGNLGNALNTLDLICSNIGKFSTLEEIKQSIFSLVLLDDFTTVNHIVKSSNKQNITVDLLFSQIDTGDNRKVSHAIDKLKLNLSTRSFEEINYFCRIFILLVREQRNLHNLPAIVELILKSKVYIRPKCLENLQDKDFSLWSSFLEKSIILNELNFTAFNRCRNKEKDKTVDLLHQIQEQNGKNLQETLFEKITKLASMKDSDNCNIRKLNLFLTKMIYKPFKYDTIAQLSPRLSEWDKTVFSNNELQQGEALSVKQILHLMQEGGKMDSDGINASIKFCLESISDAGNETLIEKLIKEARNLGRKSVIDKQQPKNINEWQEHEITQWAKKFKNSSKPCEIYTWSSSESTETISEVLSVIVRAVVIYDHHPRGPRDTQIMSLLLFLDENNRKGRLGNVYTGEGKTLITVMLATCMALNGKRVDIVTSSKVLAVRDSKKREPGTKEGYQGFFEMFGLKASNNCDEACEKSDTGEDERKSRYESCSIIYGETGYFQRDILLSQFFGKDIREGSGIGDVLILDEVDSMMIDNAAKTLYISHNITDMRHLRDVFIHIWAAVNTREERYYSEENVQKIIKHINKIIGKAHNDDSSPQDNSFKVLIPSTLYEFVENNLKTWIESAYDAKYIEEDNAYIIGDAESQKQNEVIIMDKDTGVEQTSTKWSNGLHQFIQLKHSGKLSDESLKAVYISNAGYFQSYQNLYGMTGTLGGVEERRLLSDVYGLDFFEIPRFKTYSFEYDFESETIAGTYEEWIHNIMENIDENMDQQLTYTLEYIGLMKKKHEEEKKALQKLEIVFKERTDEQNILKQQQEQCEYKMKNYEAMEKTSNEVIKICEKPVLEKFKTNITKISDDITSLKQSCTDSDLREMFEQFLNFITKVTVGDSEYVIEQSGINFKNSVKTLTVVDLNNQEKVKLEALNTSIIKIQEEIDYLSTAKTKSQKDVEFYENELKAKLGSQRVDSRRAVLIICDSIADLKCIEARVRQKFNDPNEYKPDEFKIYKYDRVYKKFDVSCLEAGDIVIATNIAGRGTDLEVSRQVEENGGLHVILSYMPKNFRIEKQAFGRTSRAGNKGTATYIVLDPRKQSEDIDIAQLKKERNELETSRLAKVQREQLPKIKLEDELFVKFNRLQQSVERKIRIKNETNCTLESIIKHVLLLQTEQNILQIPLNKLQQSLENKLGIKNDKIDVQESIIKHVLLLQTGQNILKIPLKLQMDSLKNKWAIWLNKISDKFDKIHETTNGAILKEYEIFVSEINSKLNNKYGLIEEPGELNKLGRVYMDNKQYYEALDCFNYIIEHHSSFASIAYYYKAFCIIHNEGGGFDAKVKAKEALKNSLRLLENDRSRILSRNQILQTINEFARTRGKGLDSNCFAKQNEDEAQILSVHINAINSAVGSEISPDCFDVPGIVGNQSQKVFDELLKGQYAVIKDFRISKRCAIGNKIVIKDREKQEQALRALNIDADSFQNSIKLINILEKYDRDEIRIRKYGRDYVTYQNVEHHVEYELYQKTLKILAKANIVESQIFRKVDRDTDTVANSELIPFPDVFHYCKAEVLEDLMHSLTNSRKKSWCYKERLKKPSSFETLIYTKQKFIADTASLVKVEEMIEIAVDIKQKLLGQLDHQVFCGKGDQIKSILTSQLLIINHTFLEQRFEDIKNETIFNGKKAEIKEFCLGRKKITLNDDPIMELELLDNHLFFKEDLLSALKTLTKISESSSSADKTSLNVLLIHLGFDVGSNIIAKHQLAQVIRDKTSLQEEQINNILTHLETYSKLSIDHTFLKQKFEPVQNATIFCGKKAEIKDFCLGHRKITLSNGKTIQLLDNQSFAREEIVEALKIITKVSEDTSSRDNNNFDALLMQLGFDTDVKFEAINSFKQYSLKDNTSMVTIQEYLETINLKNSSNDASTIHKIDQLNFSIDSRLSEKSGKITRILKSNLNVDKPLKKGDFLLEEEAFEILRALLTDANIITASIFNLLMEQEKQAHPELETILMRMYQANGTITDHNIVLKDAKQGSRELFNRMRELLIIKPPKVNFPLGKAKKEIMSSIGYRIAEGVLWVDGIMHRVGGGPTVLQYVGGNAWKDSSDPVKKMEYIKSKVEQVVQEVFQLTRQEDTFHKVNELLTGGIGTESKNKDLDEKIEIITNIITRVAGTIKTQPEVKIGAKDLRSMFSDGKIPPELMDYIQICFDVVLEYKEDKVFDWDCFLCAMMGVAQIVAGVSLNILSGGTAHVISQTLIAEGVGDIVFAIQASIEGNFSWKSYGQHKVQSLMMSLVTAGVGAFLSKGAQSNKLAVGLATKIAKSKAIMKTAIVEVCTAVFTAIANVGTEQISTLLNEEIANVQFVQEFEKWTRENVAYHQKTALIEKKFIGLYDKFGTTIAKKSIERCLELSLNQVLSGGLGDKIFAQVSQVVGGVTKGLATAASMFEKGNSKGIILGLIPSLVGRLVKAGEFVKNFYQLFTICNDFYDYLGVELAKIEESLAEQQKNGTLKIDETQIVQDKVCCSFSGEASEDLRRAQEKLHIAFKEKVKKGFLQPAVSTLLHLAMKPIQTMITAPFANAMQELKDHIDTRAEMFVAEILQQNEKGLVRMTTKQKKALELRGDIIKAEHITDPSILKEPLANFEGETLESLQKEHGPNLSVLIKDGKLYAVFPTSTQFFDGIQNGNIKLSGPMQLKMAATQQGRNIEVVSVQIDGSETIIPHDKVPDAITPCGGSAPEKESWKIAFVEGENGNPGHYYPVVKDQDGNWKVIRDIGQNAGTTDACFAQCMVFLKEYENNGDLKQAKSHAESAEKVSTYNKSLGKSAKHNKGLKEHYLQGSTVKRNRIVGGLESKDCARSGGKPEYVLDGMTPFYIVENMLVKHLKGYDDVIALIHRINRNEPTENSKYDVSKLKKEKKLCRTGKFIARLNLVDLLNTIIPTLKEGQEEVKNLTRIYSDAISAVKTCQVEFSQDNINGNFKIDRTGTEFPHAGKSIIAVASGEIDDADFKIKAYIHPGKEGKNNKNKIILVVDNNRGLAAYAKAAKRVGCFELISFEEAGNRNAYNRREGDGSTVQIEAGNRDPSGDRAIKMTKITSEYGRIPINMHKNLKEY